MAALAIFHNILWPRYKGAVFSRLGEQAANREIEVDFFQIAETEGSRTGLSEVDLSYHAYEYRLLFRGEYEAIPTGQLVASLIGALRGRKYALVILPGYHRVEYWAMLAWCLLSRTPAAVFCDSTGFDRPRRWYRQFAKRLFFRFCVGYFAYGQRARDYLVGLGARPERVCASCQAAALPHDYDARAWLARRLDHPFRRDAPQFLYVGRLAPEKGLPTLLQAFRRLLQRVPQAHLTLVGAGPLRARLEGIVQGWGIAAAVRFTGPLDIARLAEHYSRSTALVLPSTSEPWGLVANEALSYGCPVVASHVCGCVPELIRDGETGYAFPAGDAEALEACLGRVNKLVSDSPARTSAAAIAAVAPYTPEQVATHILDASLAIVRRTRGGSGD